MAGQDDYDCVFKLLIIGDSGVGKTSLLMRFADGLFPETYTSTIGVDVKSRVVDLNGKRVKLQLWDTAGQERFRTITSSYYRGSQGIIVVYDVSDQESFDSVQHWLAEISENGGDYCRLLVGNKSDKPRAIQTEVARQFAAEHEIELVETSAKNDDSVELAFVTLAEQIKKRMATDEAYASSVMGQKPAGGVSGAGSDAAGGGKGNSCC